MTIPKIFKQAFHRLTLGGFRNQVLAEQKAARARMDQLYDQLFLNNPVLLLPGVKIFLPLFYVDHIQKSIYETRNFYEIDTLEFLRLHYRHFGSIAEVGANIGNHVLYYCSQLSAEKVYCFEPGKFSLETLKQNIAINYLEDRVTVYPIALGSKNGNGQQTGFRLANTGMNRVHATEGESGGTAVEIRTLDSFAFDKLDFLKIDVEGAERDVLEGATETIARCKPVILVEVFDENLQHIRQWMEDRGYQKLIQLGLHNQLFVPV
ncbi:FkbM family methyltransferase [Flavisolibacter sp. BT320]|nr:FkbM family methyltransferase [Flavisolibacter longurius]